VRRGVDAAHAVHGVPRRSRGDRLRTHVREATAPYKYPRSLRFVEELPRTSTGKVRRAAIRADLAHG
jgi:acyl-coenzyme A synthetase/AMP-(fatty) acid ligase